MSSMEQITVVILIFHNHFSHSFENYYWQHQDLISLVITYTTRIPNIQTTPEEIKIVIFFSIPMKIEIAYIVIVLIMPLIALTAIVYNTQSYAMRPLTARAATLVLIFTTVKIAVTR